MSKTHRCISAFLSLILLVTWPSLAYSQTISEDSLEGDYSFVKRGEAVPYDGFLFDKSGIIKVITNKSLEIQRLTIEKDADIAKLKIEIDMLKKQHNLEIKINKELTDNIMNLKDNRIKLLEDSKKWDDIKLFGAMLLGIALSVTIFYAAVQITSIKTP